MKKLPSIRFAVLYGVLAAAAHGQTNVKVDSAPAVNKETTVEYTLPLGGDQRIQWNVGGPGAIVGDSNKVKVKVEPSDAGDIAVSCTVIPPNPDSRTGDCGVTLHVPANGSVQGAAGATGALNAAPAGSSGSTRPHATASTTTSAPSPVSPEGDLNILTEGFAPSGYQGDGQQEGGLIVDEGAPGPKNGTATKIIYSPPSKSVGWAALAWLAPNSDPAKPWGLTAGQNYANNGFASFRLLARATRNGTVKFQSGGNTASVKDVIPSTYQITSQVWKLTNDFKEYCMPLQGRNLANVFSPLTVVFTSASNPGGAEIYLADMRFSQTRC